MAKNPQKHLEKLLDQELAASPEGESRLFSSVMFEDLKNALIEYGYEEANTYNPLLEIAKIGLNNRNKDELRFRCHAVVAEYMYSKVRAVEVKKTEDRSVEVLITIKGFAQGSVSASAPKAVEADYFEIDNGDLEKEKRFQ